MSRNQRRRIDGVQQVDPVSAPQRTRVAAAPVSYAGPAPANNLRPLLEGLQSFNPALEQFIQKNVREEDEAQRVAGAAARTKQPDAIVAVPPEATPEFHEGYMLMHGQLAGHEVARKLRAAYEESKYKPDFDPEKVAKTLLDEEMKGMTDKDSLKGFLPAVTSEREKIRDEWSKLQVEKVRQDTDAQIGARARDLVEMPIRADEEGVPTDPAKTRHSLYLQFVEQGMKLGKTRMELATSYMDALINQAVSAGDPSILDVAFVRDASGIALADNPALGAKAIKAREVAEVIQKKSVIDATVGERTQTLHGLYELLRKDPMSSDLDFPNLLRHQGPNLSFNDKEGKDVVAFYEQVVKARYEHAQNAQLIEDLDGPNARIAASRPEAKPVISARYGQVWDAWMKSLEANDPDATRKFIFTNLSLHQQWGIPDERLKTLLSHINTEPDKDGKPSADFVRAYEVYAAIQQSPNKDLITDLADEHSRTLLRNFHEMIANEGMPQNAAFARAKELNTPEGQERLKALATPETRLKFRAELESALKDGHWFTLGFTGRAPNKDLFIATMTNVFERKLVTLGDRERAKKQTIESIGEYLAKDTHDNWTQRPDTALLAIRQKSQADFEKGLQAYTMDLANTLRQEGGIIAGDVGDQLYLERIGQGSAYIVKLNGAPAGRVELDEILQRGAAKDVTFDDAKTVSELVKLAKSKKMTGEQIEERLYDLEKLRQTGVINAREYEDLMVIRRKWQRQTIDKHVDAARAAQKSALGGLDPKDILREPGELPEDPQTQPGGKNLKTADYALQALSKGNLTFALTAQAEGFVTKRYNDAAKGQNIGIGFSLSARTKPETMSILRRAGVPSGDVEAVMEGRLEIKPEVVIRLHEIMVDDYRRKAVRAVGQDVWKALKPEAQAVLTDMAWVTGKPEQFKQVLEAMRKGDWKGASAAMSLKYTDRNGVQKDDTRRVRLWRLMLSGRDTYASYLKKHTSK